MYASFAHASGHTHCERLVRDIGRFVAVVKVYWLARVARPSNAIHAQAWAPGLADAEYAFDGEFPWCQHEHQQQPLSVAIVSSCDPDSLRSSASDEDSVASMYAAGSPSTLQSAADTIADTIPGTVPFRGCPFDEWDAWHNGTAVDSMIAPASQTGNIYSKNAAEIGQTPVGDSADASCCSNADGPSRFPPVISAVASQVLLRSKRQKHARLCYVAMGPFQVKAGSHKTLLRAALTSATAGGYAAESPA